VAIESGVSCKKGLKVEARTAIKQKLIPEQTTQTSSVRCTQTPWHNRDHQTDVSDESGCQWPGPASYSYSRVRTKRIEQTERRNGRISILGVWQPTVKYALACGSFKSEIISKVIVDWIAGCMQTLGQQDG